MRSEYKGGRDGWGGRHVAEECFFQEHVWRLDLLAQSVASPTNGEGVELVHLVGGVFF